VLIVWKLDRLGRSVRDLVNILHDWEQCGIGFQSRVAQQGVQRTGGYAPRFSSLFTALGFSRFDSESQPYQM
jgi:DNA invertase Pin-like site-specific DNA recombinase